jgi:hypothetical protein
MNRALMLGVAVIIALLLAFGGSYLVVVSQNPASSVSSGTQYGSVP